ncbi:nucleotidyl transferase AbiEii/AbiGii toxin family protein [Proteus mirabilis]|uniref:nucleotidyl transferase AbiEii/AbiGii toxin family protein n=1 Tax=Proteus mirabilis TaxID=584 RepID=UPI0034E4DD0A
MDRDSIYYKQVLLLIRMLPIIAIESVFALKGGTAINLFIRHFPRLSVDIDLAYLPIEPREQALTNVRASLLRIVKQINLLPNIKAVLQDSKDDELRIIVSDPIVTIKIEVSPVARGTLHDASILSIQDAVEDEFGYAEIAVVSIPDLYGGKICAALDRQHPRDLFDIKMLLDEEGISREIFIGFLTYLLGHPRPINEIMAPNWQPLDEKFKTEFNGMTLEQVELNDLIITQRAMISALKIQFTEKDKYFLLSFKNGEPDWSLYPYPKAAELPAVKWKLLNINKLRTKNPKKHAEQWGKLEKVLDGWLQR